MRAREKSAEGYRNCGRKQQGGERGRAKRKDRCHKEHTTGCVVPPRLAATQGTLHAVEGDTGRKELLPRVTPLRPSVTQSSQAHSSRPLQPPRPRHAARLPTFPEAPPTTPFADSGMAHTNVLNAEQVVAMQRGSPMSRGRRSPQMRRWVTKWYARKRRGCHGRRAASHGLSSEVRAQGRESGGV